MGGVGERRGVGGGGRGRGKERIGGKDRGRQVVKEICRGEWRKTVKTARWLL